MVLVDSPSLENSQNCKDIPLLSGMWFCMHYATFIKICCIFAFSLKSILSIYLYISELYHSFAGEESCSSFRFVNLLLTGSILFGRRGKLWFSSF